ncbi:MAG: hypothetical protein K9M45_07815 [Kiritimatiellales bacterium]|nr:hypothetical protein [Kiritimatiellales bacterium]
MSLTKKRKAELLKRIQIIPFWKDGKILTDWDMEQIPATTYYKSKTALREAEGNIPDEHIKEGVDGFYNAGPDEYKWQASWAKLPREEQRQARDDENRKWNGIPLDKDLPSDKEQREIILARHYKRIDEEDEYIREVTLDAWEERLDEFLAKESDCRTNAARATGNGERRQLLREADLMREQAEQCCKEACELCTSKSEIADIKRRLRQTVAKSLANESDNKEGLTKFELALKTGADSWLPALEYNLLWAHFKGAGKHHAKKARDTLAINEQKGRTYYGMLHDKTKDWRAFRAFYAEYKNSQEATAIIEKYTSTQ